MFEIGKILFKDGRDLTSDEVEAMEAYTEREFKEFERESEIISVHMKYVRPYYKKMKRTIVL